MMPQDSFINLLNRVCKIPEDLNVKPSKMNDKCFLDLYFLHDKVGLDSHELYDGVQYWDSKSFCQEIFISTFFCIGAF